MHGSRYRIKALPGVLKQCPTAEFHIYGEGGVIQDLALTTELGIQQSVFLLQPVPVNKIPQILVDSDVGVVPKEASFGAGYHQDHGVHVPGVPW